MVDTSPFSIEECLVSMWVHEKGQSGQSYDEIRANIALHFNKAPQTESNLHKLEEKRT
jgi:hypothetical protein